MTVEGDVLPELLAGYKSASRVLDLTVSDQDLFRHHRQDMRALTVVGFPFRPFFFFVIPFEAVWSTVYM